MSVNNKAKNLLNEWQKDEWFDTVAQQKTVIDEKEFQQYSIRHNTLKILMEDMKRNLAQYDKVNTNQNLEKVVTKYKKANEYYDNYKYQSMLEGIKHGSTIK